DTNLGAQLWTAMDGIAEIVTKIRRRKPTMDGCGHTERSPTPQIESNIPRRLINRHHCYGHHWNCLLIRTVKLPGVESEPAGLQPILIPAFMVDSMSPGRPLQSLL